MFLSDYSHTHSGVVAFLQGYFTSAKQTNKQMRNKCFWEFNIRSSVWVCVFYCEVLMTVKLTDIRN